VIRDRLQSDLKAALRARDDARVAVLRTTLAALGNAEAVDPSDATTPSGLLGDVARRDLSEDDVRGIVLREREELARDADELRRLGRPEADRLDAQVAILDGYLAAAPVEP
jgi:uncharacterized protein YqeY